MHDSCCSSFTQGMIHVLWLYKIQRKEKKWGAEQHRSWKNKEKLDEDMEEERNREGRTTNEERRKNRTSNKGRNPETDTGEPRTSKKKSSTIHEEREDENTDTNGRAWKLRKVVRKQKENPKAPTDEEENHHILQTPASPLISPGRGEVRDILDQKDRLEEQDNVKPYNIPSFSLNSTYFFFNMAFFFSFNLATLSSTCSRILN
ncbi:hypothetical protein POPTR_001G439825v4 [Populus trichocarpa]|uniref:Uncharacterized protein n=1 Tax=Populus trichocarpa TaxID=3694 RepID=A0ACC0TQ47_POPTR|nr:hypothetical protein POPTR_001G439825v4 [Populus trichocarpa]